ncbi:MAG: hypothetical protein WAW31_09795 [Smithella sp.]
MKNKILIIFIFLFVFNFNYAYGNTYCTKINLCYDIPEGFILITRENSEQVSAYFKQKFPNQNIGFYADLYGAFYENKILPSDRVYMKFVETGALFIIFITKRANENTGFLGEKVSYFRKIGAFKKVWPRDVGKKGSLKSAFEQGLKKGLEQPNQRTGIESGSGKILWYSMSKKYFAAERTVDVNTNMIDKMRDSGIEVNDQTIPKAATDSYAIQFNEKGMVLMQYFGDISDNITNHYPIFKKVLDDVK